MRNTYVKNVMGNDNNEMFTMNEKIKELTQHIKTQFPNGCTYDICSGMILTLYV